jgi:broad specificity phosphatase PhoE
MVGQAGGREADRAKGAKVEIDRALKREAGGSDQETVYIMRHGRTALDALKRSDGWLDFPLTDEGRRGLIPAQQFLKDIPTPPIKIYTPSLKRTMETAEIIQSGMGMVEPDIVINDAARTWNLGKQLQGGKKKPNKPLVKYFMRHPDKTPKDGESLNDFRDRFLSWLRNIMAENKDGPILLVLSGSNIREISQVLMGDRESCDLDEGGLMELKPSGKSWTHSIILGGKHISEEEPATYGS